MAEKTKAVKAPKLADPIEASVDVATQKMIVRSHELGVETIFDRAVNMKQCNIGLQGTCCKNCAMGPWAHVAYPFPKRALKVKTPEKVFAVPQPTPLQQETSPE